MTMTTADDAVIEIETETGAGAEQTVAGESTPATVLYAYSIAMLTNGQVQVITDPPYQMERAALNSDVQMSAQYVADVLRAQIGRSVD